MATALQKAGKMENGSATSPSPPLLQPSAVKKRPREAQRSDESRATKASRPDPHALAPSADVYSNEPPLSAERADSPSQEQRLPTSASAQSSSTVMAPSPPVVAPTEATHRSADQTGVEADGDAEEQLLRALEEELEAQSAVATAAAFQDADEDDNYDESDDDDDE